MFYMFVAAFAAQPVVAPEPVAATETIVPATRSLKALTKVDLEFVDTASSRSSKSGDLVRMRTSADVQDASGIVLISKGSPAVAEIIQASPGRMMGKAGELTLAARYIEVGDRKIPLKRFAFGRSSGKDNNSATFIATAVIGLPGLLISGGNVDIAVGAPAYAVVVSDTEFAEAAPATSSPQGGK
jgi:hypothetical protein